MMMTAPELGGARGDEKFVTLTRLHGCEQDKERDREMRLLFPLWFGLECSPFSFVVVEVTASKFVKWLFCLYSYYKLLYVTT
jgi:hypothetical protein